jgi:hypothetical protein
MTDNRKIKKQCSGLDLSGRENNNKEEASLMRYSDQATVEHVIMETNSKCF